MKKYTCFTFALIASVPSVALAQNAQQFDLNCTGTEETSNFFGDESSNYSSHYRIDLTTGEWCESQCKAVHKIASVQPTQITLEQSATDTSTDRTRISNFINRETGAHTVSVTSANPRDRRSIIIRKNTGQCERTAFSGFPKFETKF